jgi:predicted HD superfamily hydrolase involved in NAD metabolism
MGINPAFHSNPPPEPNDVPNLRCAITQQTPDAVTLAHEQRTATLARELAVLHGVDPDRAELAALVHDIAAHHAPPQLAALAMQFRIPVSDAEALQPALLHGPVGAEILRREYGVRDDELLDAVRTHVVGSPVMGPLAKILYLADKLESGRDRLTHALEAVRDEARQDLDGALLDLYTAQIVDLAAQGQPIDERTVAARNALLARNPGRA